MKTNEDKTFNQLTFAWIISIFLNACGFEIDANRNPQNTNMCNDVAMDVIKSPPKKTLNVRDQVDTIVRSNTHYT